MKVTVTTGVRLHLGLLGEVAPAGADDPLARRAGGVGLMVDPPAVRVQAESANQTEVHAADPSIVERATDLLTRIHQLVGSARVQPVRMEITCPREHTGLGVGTQLSLAVGAAYATLVGLPWSLEKLAGWAQRARRSGVGTHGFARGGLLVDGGHPSAPPAEAAPSLPPLLTRVDFPADWPIVLIQPGDPRQQGCHGAREEAFFDRRPGSAAERTDRLCRLLLLGLLPAVAERNWPAFGAAAYQYNRLVGEAFAEAQGGAYADPQAEAIVAFVRRLGVAGVGQSSWGPTLWAIASDRDRADRLVAAVQREFRLPDAALTVTHARNRGVEMVAEGSP